MADLEQRIAQAMHELAGDPAPIPGLGERVEAIARRRRRTRLTGAAAAAAVVALAVVLTVTWGLTGMRPLGSRSAPASHRTTDVPPPMDQRGRHLVLMPAELPLTGGQVLVVLADPAGAAAARQAFNGSLDRWDGTSWQHLRDFEAGPLQTGHSGGLLSPSTPPGVIDFRGLLPLDGNGYGLTLSFQVGSPKQAPLPAGYYRVRMSGTAGMLQVRAGAAQPPLLVPPLPQELTPTLGVEGVVPANTATDLQVIPPTHVANRAQGPHDLVSGGNVRLERWDGPSWVFIRTLRPTDQFEHGGVDFHVHLPGLPSGLYRITRTIKGFGAVQGCFPVLPSLT